MNTVFLLVGPPASGKSTWAEQYVTDHPGTVLVCRDNIREMQGFPPMGNKEQEKVVTQIQKALIEGSLADGHDVVVANTNINKEHRRNLINLAHANGADVAVMVFPTALEECHRRNFLRDRVVPGHVIDKMHRDMEKQLKDGSLKAGDINCQRFQPYEHRSNKPDAIVCDLDGTVAGHNREPYDYSKLSSDSPIADVIDVIRSLSDGYTIIFLTGRSIEYMVPTMDWLYKNAGIEEYLNGWQLWMRPEGDKRPDYIVKNEVLERDIIPDYNIVMAFEDRVRVVRHLRNRGITVAHVADGRY